MTQPKTFYSAPHTSYLLLGIPPLIQTIVPHTSTKTACSEGTLPAACYDNLITSDLIATSQRLSPVLHLPSLSTGHRINVYHHQFAERNTFASFQDTASQSLSRRLRVRRGIGV